MSKLSKVLLISMEDSEFLTFITWHDKQHTYRLFLKHIALSIYKFKPYSVVLKPSTKNESYLLYLN